MKLLHIMSGDEDCLEECLIPVGDDYSNDDCNARERVLEDAFNYGGVEDPYIETIYSLATEADYTVSLNEHRVFVG